jgi:hypothetical protein
MIPFVDLSDSLSAEPSTPCGLAQTVIAAVVRVTGVECDVLVQHYEGQEMALVRVAVHGRPVIRVVRVRDFAAACGRLAVAVALMLARDEQVRGLAS